MIQSKCRLLDRVLVLNPWYKESDKPCHFFWVIVWIQFSMEFNSFKEEYHVKEVYGRKLSRHSDTLVIKLKDILASYQMWNLNNVKQSRWFVWFSNKESQYIRNYILSFVKKKEIEDNNIDVYTDYE